MKKLKFMPGYDCYPLWEILPDGVDNIDPASLGLPSSILTALDSWADEFDDTLNRDDPIKSGFQSDEEEANFELKGRKIYEEICDNLRGRFDVVYWKDLEK